MNGSGNREPADEGDLLSRTARAGEPADSIHDDPVKRDVRARALALGVARSWLVQAPAGSGKTELLVQRVLALLAHVDVPERVVATTFTVKAAAEMRERVMRALTEARDGIAAESPHHGHTLELARAVLLRDRERGWQLPDFPGRLDIGTLDALASRIAGQLPVSSQFGRVPQVAENAIPLYRAAAQRAIAAAPVTHTSWRTLIGHFDNAADRVADLLATMLAKRDQWMPPLLSLRDRDTRDALERTLAEEVEAALVALDAQWPADLLADLLPLVRYARRALGDDATLAEIDARRGLPAPSAQSLPHWRRLADWLLNQQGALLRSLPQGFPAIGKGAGADERREQNERVRGWLKQAAGVRGLASGLHRARLLPEPSYSARASAFIDALVDVLPRVVAELTLVFREENTCDFVEVTLRALQALGTADDPSQILLAQDLRVQHLLIDEFQDTSLRQLQLIEKLTSGWEPGDGRTLFVVGDPMQSIYAFREADVRNFVNAARDLRIGQVAVGKLDLARNFRSQEALVDHVNATFPAVLEELGARIPVGVTFGAAVAALPHSGETPTLDLVHDARAESLRVVAHVQAALADGLEDVAILVRARAHVDMILQALRESAIAYTAVKLDSLAERPLSRDLLWLARALSQPADRLAWLSVLRAPWCGLALPDLLRFAELSATTTPSQALQDPVVREALSADGAARLGAMAAIIARVTRERHLPLAARVHAAWIALRGPACYGTDPSNAVAAEALFALLDRHRRGGDIEDWDLLQDEAARLQADSVAASDAKVKVMTLHAAKGLEFDAVILPALARPSRNAATELLRWRARHPDRALLIGTPRARDEEDPDPIDAWLKALEDDDGAAELARLLYVGFTRARRRLHLTAVANAEADDKTQAISWKPPRRNSSLGMLWPALQSRANEATLPAAAEETDAGAPAPPLLRLPHAHAGVDLSADVPAISLPDVAGASVIYDWAQADAAAVGTVVHRMLAQMSGDGTPIERQAALARQRVRIAVELAAMGVALDARAEGVDRAIDAMTHAIDDPQGRWLFAPTHTDVHAEWTLTSAGESGIERIAIDRSFVADGTRWIVDFKTSRHQGGDVDAFLATEQARHGPQLERYARVLRRQEDLPIMLALYYPALRALRSWRFAC